MTRVSRWEQGHHGYGARFAQLLKDGVDITGEARLADTLLPRSGRVLDAGCGMGRIAAALEEAGHDAYGVDLDAELLAQAGKTYPALPVAQVRLEDVSPDSLAAQEFPSAYDLIVCVGNVMTFLAEDSERPVLAALRTVVTPEGRLLVGFHQGGGSGRRNYPADEFIADAEAGGWQLESRFATYDLRPEPGEDMFFVGIFRAA
ncbi:SAM-dependent methyltransferase [Flexivirga endophytica]|uniref:SAM-dependent methyltransferase n=1 Tax=Flexivirga endophytica TaxID=1849103 RepID=A0A916SU33_9MICO|nr:class I SAM-dependent methyltransferase [Flexivirga endophytica]GGB16360.1 SAM-dependent methyltransferase [Flexivirga endophytica]GHB39231.1 SAM-dependent methyltransferase [Flexivirga endophytica]